MSKAKAPESNIQTQTVVIFTVIPLLKKKKKSLNDELEEITELWAA